MDQPDRRLLLVHAHPDDETIQSGLAMARYAAEGAGVTLVTCTLGEEGEVLIPALAHLASRRDDTLGEHRIAELAVAMKNLGVTDHSSSAARATIATPGWSMTSAATRLPG